MRAAATAAATSRVTVVRSSLAGVCGSGSDSSARVRASLSAATAAWYSFAAWSAASRAFVMSPVRVVSFVLAQPSSWFHAAARVSSAMAGAP